MMIQTYILIKTAEHLEHLEHTPPVDPGDEKVTLGIGFVKWKRYTNDFLVRLGKSSGAFRKNSPDSTRLTTTTLIAFEQAVNVGHLPYHLDVYCVERHQRAGGVIIVPPLICFIAFLSKVPCRYSGS